MVSQQRHVRKQKSLSELKGLGVPTLQLPVFPKALQDIAASYKSAAGTNTTSASCRSRLDSTSRNPIMPKQTASAAGPSCSLRDSVSSRFSAEDDHDQQQAASSALDLDRDREFAADEDTTPRNSRHFSGDSVITSFSYYFHTPKRRPQPLALQNRQHKSPRHIKSMEAVNNSLIDYTVSPVEQQLNNAGEQFAEYPPVQQQEQYLSMAELLAQRGFADTRVVTPESAKFRTPTERPGLASILDLQQHNNQPSTALPSSPPQCKPSLRQKPSLVGLIGSLWSTTTAATPPAIPVISPVIEPAEASPRSVSSHTSNETLSELDTSEELDPRAALGLNVHDPTENQRRISRWVSTSKMDSPARSASVADSHRSASSGSTCPSIDSICYSPPMLSPAILTADHASARDFLSVMPVSPAYTEQSTSSGETVQPSDHLRQRLRHAASSPALNTRKLKVPVVAERRPSLVEVSAQGSTAKSIRKTASTAVLRTAPLVPVLTLDEKAPFAGAGSGKGKALGVAESSTMKTSEMNRVIKIPSPERRASVVPQGQRGDVRELFGQLPTPSTSTAVSEDSSQPKKVFLVSADENNSPAASKAAIKPKRAILGTLNLGTQLHSAAPSSSSTGSSKSKQSGAKEHLKDLLGKTTKTLPFSIGIVPPQGMKRGHKHAIADEENVPLVTSDRR